MYNVSLTSGKSYDLAVAFMTPTSFSPGYKTLTRSANICLSRKWTGISPFGASGMTFSRPCKGSAISVGMERQSYNLLEYTSVQQPFGSPALPHMMVVVIETIPVMLEFLQAILVDIFQPAVG
jgi:hypothetical protein